MQETHNDSLLNRVYIAQNSRIKIVNNSSIGEMLYYTGRAPLSYDCVSPYYLGGCI